jgi:hypothetical protein
LPEASDDQTCTGDASIARVPPLRRDALQDLARTKLVESDNKVEGDRKVALFALFPNVGAGSD